MRHLAYYAGFFDAEGCVRLERGRLRAYVSNTYRPVLDELMQAYGGNIYNVTRSNSTKQAWTWITTGREARAFLQAILPFMAEKRERAEKAMRTATYMHYSVARVREKYTLPLPW